MYHVINEAVVVPLIWNDDTNSWVIDPNLRTGAPLELSQSNDLEHHDCPCRETTTSGETSQEHDVVANRAVGAPVPTLDDLSFIIKAAK